MVLRSVRRPAESKDDASDEAPARSVHVPGHQMSGCCGDVFQEGRIDMDIGIAEAIDHEL
jgi:hypothetical protein